MPVVITAFYAGLLSLCYLYLSILVVRERSKNDVSLGTGDVEELNRAIRCHSNFSEYVPICLILLACLELNSGFEYIIHGCAIALLFGRLLHAYGLRNHAGSSWQRKWGVLLTFCSLSVLAIANLSLIYWDRVGVKLG